MSQIVSNQTNWFDKAKWGVIWLGLMVIAFGVKKSIEFYTKWTVTLPQKMLSIFAITYVYLNCIHVFLQKKIVENPNQWRVQTSGESKPVESPNQKIVESPDKEIAESPDRQIVENQKMQEIRQIKSEGEEPDEDDESAEAEYVIIKLGENARKKDVEFNKYDGVAEEEYVVVTLDENMPKKRRHVRCKSVGSKIVVSHPNVKLRCCQPAAYDAARHGINGEKVRNRYFFDILASYTKELGRCFKIFVRTFLLPAQGISSDPQRRLSHIFSLLPMPGIYDFNKNWENQYVEFVQKHRDLIRVCEEDLLTSNQAKLAKRYSAEIDLQKEDSFKNYQLVDCLHNEKASKDYADLSLNWETKIPEITRAIAYVRMTVNIVPHQKNLVECHYQDMPALTASNFHEDIAERNEAIRRCDARIKLSKKSSIIRKLYGANSFCNYFDWNPPNLRKTEIWQRGSTTREIWHLRHATPHVSKSGYWQPGPVPIDSTYTEFLRYAEEQGEGVLYAAHQRYGDFVFFGAEGPRAQSIVDLETKHPNLLVLFQSVENDLFQDGALTFAKLKDELLNSFQVKGRAQNHPPRRLISHEDQNCIYLYGEYLRDLGEIFDFVHQTFFASRPNIDQTGYDFYANLNKKAKPVKEWQACIMLFYHFQREHLKMADLRQYGYAFPIKYVNTGCKDNFDRGGAQNVATDRVHQTQIYGNAVPNRDLEALLSSVQAPPILTKGVAIIPYRMHPALYVSYILANLPQDPLQALREKQWDGWALSEYRYADGGR